MQLDPRQIARRAVGRALASAGRNPNPADRVSGVHVARAPQQAEDPSRPGSAPETVPTAPKSAFGDRLRIAIGADHGGFPLKCDLIDWVRDLGHLPLDLGTHGPAAVDYPDFAAAVAESVAEGRADLGICVDGAGIGSTMAANKVPGSRAANCYDVVSAKNAREHNFANVLCLGGPRLAPSLALEILRAFISTPTGAVRHERRVAKITAIESRYCTR